MAGAFSSAFSTAFDVGAGGGFLAAWAIGASQTINPLGDGMKKNVASQKVGAQLTTAADGTPFTGSVTVAVTVDAGTQATGSVGSGACTHEGGGYHTYAPAQAETNGDLIAFTFSGTGAISTTVQVYTLPTTGVLAPATADRTIVVDASGRALSDVDTIKTQTVTCAAGVTVYPAVGTTATVKSNHEIVYSTDFASNYSTSLDRWVVQLAGATHTSAVIPTVTTTTTATNLTNAPTSGDFTATMKTSIGTAVAASAVASVTGNVGGNVAGSVGSVTGAVGSVTATVSADVVSISGSSTAANNAEIVFDTDFATNYNTTVDMWNVNLVDISGSAVSAMTAQLGVNVVAMNNNVITASVVNDGTITAGKFASDAITAAKLATDAVTKIVDAVVACFSDDTGTAQAGGSTSVTLRSGAVATDDYYNGAIVTIYGGTGEGQSRKITGYVGSTKVATVDSAWAVNPDSSSTYFVIGRSV